MSKRFWRNIVWMLLALVLACAAAPAAGEGRQLPSLRSAASEGAALIVLGTPRPTATPTPKPTATPRPSATRKPTATPKPTTTAAPTAAPTPVPTATAAPTATPVPTPLPTAAPVVIPARDDVVKMPTYTPGTTPRATPALTPPAETPDRTTPVPTAANGIPLIVMGTAVPPDYTAPSETPPLPTDKPTPKPSPTPKPTARPWTPTPSPTLSPAPAVPPAVIDRVNHPTHWTDVQPDPGADWLIIDIPDIHDCDCALLRCGGETLLIDCGDIRQVNSILAMLEESGIERIDTVFITHPHHDHIGCFGMIARRWPVGRLVVTFPLDQDDQMKKLVAEARSMSIPVCRAEDGEIMTLGGATIELIDRVPESYSMNNRSAQQYLTFGERTMLFTADLERYGMMAMLEEMNPEDLRADILKYPHHGKSGLVPEYYDAVQPLLSVMTNYERGLEGQESMSMRKRPYVCSMYGGLRLTCDGTRWFVERPVKSEADAEPKEEAP